jgi:Na+/H+ antiporter NhaD/arsenite permease-like protein
MATGAAVDHGPALAWRPPVTAWVAACAFALTWLLIAVPRLPLLPVGRAGGALLGAVLMVAGGVLTASEAWAAIDGDTIALLLGMMLMNAGLAETGLIDRAARVLASTFPGPRAMLAAVAVTSALSSAFLVNDTVCLLMTPVVVKVCVRARLPLGPFLLVLATSANLGSAMTLVGNPQNMLIGSMSGVSFSSFFLRMLPVTLVALAAHVGLSLAYFGRTLATAPRVTEAPREGDAAPLGPRAWLMLFIFGAVIAAFFADAHLGVTALGGGVAVLATSRTPPSETFRRVDWELLVFFAGLFIATRGLAASGLVLDAWSAIAPALQLHEATGVASFTAALTLGSNLVSNVPLVLLGGPFIADLGAGEAGWLLLAWVATLAGNLTLVGSVANLIVAESARDHHTLGFLEYLRFGALATVTSLGLGVPAILLLM